MARAKSPERVLRELGRRIRAARINAGITQEAAAHAADIDYKRWQRIESGSVNLTVRTLVRVCDAVGSDIWELTGPK